MQIGVILVDVFDMTTRELTLFAAIWFLVGGLDDFFVDVIYFGCRLLPRGVRKQYLDRLTDRRAPFAIFVPAWDESAVIGAMLRTALQRFEGDFRLYVGAYPNDRATIDAIAAVAETDSRIRLVVHFRQGPTTKADCLNSLWHALLTDEVAEGRVSAIVLHDAEDVVHAGELAVYAQHLGHADAVQIPVLPLIDPASPLVSGHYADEFCEAHAKSLPVRMALGAGLPFAGTGCAISREMLGRIAAARSNLPFDATSLTEDYELGLTIAAMGGRTVLARERRDGELVAVRAYFPASIDASVRQKARWLTGIALAGWDRTGWHAGGNLCDHWMRMRDRRATLAMPVLAVAYAALVGWGVSLLLHRAGGAAPLPLTPLMQALLAANLALLGWRTAVRAAFVAHSYGWRQALWTPARMLVANYIALLAARRAAGLYANILRGGAPHWDKTAHQFPADIGQFA